MTFEAVAMWIFEKVAGSAVGLLVKEGVQRTVPILRSGGAWGAYAKYVTELREELGYMPFQYRDLKLTLPEAFVKIDLSVISHEYLQSWEEIFDRARPSPERDVLSNDFVSNIPRRARIVVVGDAGAGKTTVLRYSALLCVSQEGRLDVPNFRPGPIIPVYVPLKALDSVTTLPIISYVQDRYAYFRGNGGLARLTKFAKQGRLLFLLDGYDEVLVSENFSRIQSELRLLYYDSVGSIDFMLRKAGADRFNYRLNRFFMAFCGAGGRLVLSSRREFFNIHFPRDVRNFSIAINQGLKTNKGDLVKNIFSACIRRSPDIYTDRLDHEIFLHEFARLPDDTLTTLASSPLLLSVMCFVYVDHVRSGNAPTSLGASPFTDGGFGIVDQFIDLLLRDIDQSKTHDMKGLRRTAFMQRRSEFHDAKKEFLRFLAARLFIEDKGLIEYSFAESLAMTFFESYEVPSERQAILRGLKDRASPEHILTQLVNCGVLLRQPSSVGAVRYDFPHRRFREVLAADYFGKPGRLELLFAALNKASIYELLPVFVVRNKMFDKIIERLLQNIFAGIEPVHMGYHLDRLLEIPSYSHKAPEILFSVISGLKDKHTGKALPERLLRHFGRDQKHIADYRMMMHDGSSASGGSLTALLAKPIAVMETDDATGRLRETLRGRQSSEDRGWAALSGESRPLEVGSVVEMVKAICPSKNLRNLTAEQAELLIEALDALPSRSNKETLNLMLVEWSPLTRAGVALDPMDVLRQISSFNFSSAIDEPLEKGSEFRWV